MESMVKIHQRKLKTFEKNGGKILLLITGEKIMYFQAMIYIEYRVNGPLRQVEVVMVVKVVWVEEQGKL